MSTDIFNNGTEGDFETGASWAGGVAPGAGDVAVIDSTGDVAASLAGNGNIFTEEPGDSIADLTDAVMTVPDPIFVFNNTSNPPVSYEYFPDTSPTAQATPGETVAGETVDLIGGGSVAALYLQNATLAADTAVDVSGTAVLDDEFTDQLDGTISIGAPFSVNGNPVIPPAANANGFVNELDIRVRAAGSWTYDNGSYTTSGYVPATVNNGTIDIGAGSAFRVQLLGQDSGATSLVPNQVIVDPPEATAFVNAGSIVVGAGGSAEFYAEADTPVGAPPDDAAPLENVVNTGGVVAVEGAAGATTALLVQTAFTGGTVLVAGGTATAAAATVALFSNTVTGTTFVIDNATLSLMTGTNGLGVGDANQFTGGAIDFTGTGGVLSIGTSTGSFTTELDTAIGNITTPIEGFAAGDAIDLVFEFGDSSPIIAEGTFTFQTIWTQATNQLEIQETVVPPSFYMDQTPQTEIVADLTLIGTYNAADFSISYPADYDGQNDSVTLVVTTSDIPCFVAGTLLATPRGRVAVEALAAGDLVLTVSGQARPIVWAGHRCVDVARHPSPELVRPVCINAGAFAPRQPDRDLLVSPDHNLFVDGVLIPAKCLVNGRTVVELDMAAVTYHHIELATHDVVLANNMPAETYLDTGNRANFAGEQGTVEHPDFWSAPDLNYFTWIAAGYAPLILVGPELDAVRARLDARADLPVRELLAT